MFFYTPMIINLIGFKINTVDNASVVNSGTLQFVDQLISYKRNQAVGEQNGDFSPINIPIATITDQDGIDSNTNKNSGV
ncbi:hypothetical protein [Peribacillus glennii]|uniref:Uncharacterized protein n=1 Tax=Peribacillus glennii TaxID=2303991 RepID=A0A372L8A5_9BACI|nr:hypothetical protein [Peribacillus glennii]RFU60563.1 hypothetical protein D0466_21330 [Peribacillus glennii]